ncbi:MAG: hypothetical protein H6744_18210 [Deltaproteobacteria bacterium]|nr:hypothetical protein [Deltaproteobacteria bacterium]
MRAALSLLLLCAAALPPTACDSGSTSNFDVPADATGDSAGDLPQASPETSFTPVDLVTAREYQALLVEIDHVSGHGPNAAALSQLEQQLDALRAAGHLAKPGGVRFVIDEVLTPVGADHVSTFDELQALAQAHRSLVPAPGEAAIHVLYVDGHYQDDSEQSQILGFAYGGSWLVMLADNIDGGCDSSPLLSLPGLSPARDQVCARAESTVFMHELGHLFGLVDNGAPMVTPHEDADHAHHDANEDCLMYWAIQGSKAIDLIAQRFKDNQQGAVSFDAACLADLDALIAGR